MEKFQELVKAAVERFAQDPSAPGVHVSWLKDRGQWYLSIVRFHEPFGQGRQVIFKLACESLETLIDQALEAVT